MEIWNLFLQHFSAFPFVLQVSVLFLNTGPNLSISMFYFIVNYECSIRELEEKMRTSLYALLETRNASSTPELFWIGQLNRKRVWKFIGFMEDKFLFKKFQIVISVMLFFFLNLYLNKHVLFQKTVITTAQVTWICGTEFVEHSK